MKEEAAFTDEGEQAVPGTKEQLMGARWHWMLPGFGMVLAIAVFAGGGLLAGSKVLVGRPCTEPDRPSVGKVSHDAFDTLLQKYVDDHGMVTYARWKENTKDIAALDEYLESLSCVDLASPAATEERLAFWINAYNAVTLKGILREYPTTSIRNHTAKLAGYNIWKDLCLWVDGKEYSLEDIEHKVLRQMGEPRIHFALVCASRGCPPLANRAYTAAGLVEQLTANARRFFAQPTNFQTDSRTVHVSQLLKWYGTDFAATPVEQLRLLRPYLPSAENLTWMDRGSFPVRYLDYDWALNDRSPVSR
ncbi:MAG: DUF547 domain-containing protein [Gemmataceae bacterium]|nr:DUF547 domain-containing protein [Gemmataceae bacterium]